MQFRQLVAGLVGVWAAVSAAAQAEEYSRFVEACEVALSVTAPEDIHQYELDVRQVHRRVFITALSPDRSERSTVECLFRDLGDAVPELVSLSSGDIVLNAAENPAFNEAIWKHFVGPKS